MTSQTCELCGHTFAPSAAPGGMCPRCLLLGGADEVPADVFSLEDLRDVVPGFRVEALLGRGGMGAVFRARQLDLDRDVAIKFIAARAHDPSFSDRFEREARLLARLNHPHIVTVHSYGRIADGHAYIVMEHVAGGDLAQLIAAGVIPEPIALSLVEQVCGALAYAHERGCVHRDIKPGNILIDTRGHAKVADFGLAKILGESATPAPALTLSFVGLGTPLYAAPEQMKPGVPVDHRADIYALGVLLYEMITGEVPRGLFRSPSQKTGALVRWDRIIVRAMEALPERRFGSTVELTRELTVIRRALGRRQRVRRHGGKWLVLLVLLVLLLAISAGVVWRSLPVDIQITRAGQELVVSGGGTPLVLSMPEPGRFQIAAPEQTFRVGWGHRTRDRSALFPLASGQHLVVRTRQAVSLEGNLLLPPDTSLEVEAGRVSMAEAAHLASTRLGRIALRARGGIALERGAIVETENGGITLIANPGGGTDGAAVGIELTGATVTTSGTGNIMLVGRGGAERKVDHLHGVHLRRGAVIRSTQAAAGAGALEIIGTSGRLASGSRGVQMTDEGTKITSLEGAITVEGKAGAGEGDNGTGIDIRDGAQVISSGIGPGAAAITLRGTGGPRATGDYICGVQIGCTDGNRAFGAGVFTYDGPITLAGTGGAGGVLLNGVFIGDGTAVVASGAGSITLNGTGGNGSRPASAGVMIFGRHANGSVTQVSVSDGDLILQGYALEPGSSDISIESPAIVRAMGKGKITLRGRRVTQTGEVSATSGEVRREALK